MNTQNPTFPFYGKTSTNAILKFDSEKEGICLKGSSLWNIGQKWRDSYGSCLSGYVTPLTEREIKDNNLPELKQMNTTINPVTGLAVTFPLLAKHNHSDLVVQFTSENEGTVVSGSNYKVGHHCSSWTGGCFFKNAWTILEAKPASREKQGRKAEVLGDSHGFSREGLPPSFYILTENSAYWAAIEAKLFELGYTYYGDTSHREYENYVYIRGDSNKHLNYNPDTNPLKTAYPHAVEITMAELFAISNPKPAFVEKDIYFHGYKGTIKEDSLVIGCQTIKYDNLAKIAKKVDEFMSLQFELGGMFKDIGTQTKINHSGITVIAESESKTIPFADFLALYKQTKGD